jgi:AraC family transcriptional regulator, transcriptional activator of pobA
MRDYRPLLLQTLDVRVPGLRILRLRLNRHLSGVDGLEDHAHRFTQTLCYLSGRGTLRLGGAGHEVVPGTVAMVPAGRVHGFREGTGRRPLTLAMDLEMRGARTRRPLVGHLNESEISRIRHSLSELNRLKDPCGADARFAASSAALAILDIHLRALGILERPRHVLPALVRTYARLAADPANLREPVSSLAARSGHQADYLNRKFKQATGLTLLQHRNVIRLGIAKKALARGLEVQDAAFEAGFDDPNYFARWFKRQTGLPPSKARWNSTAPRP